MDSHSQLSHLFSQETRRRAQNYLEQGRVTIDVLTENLIVAQVSGSRGNFYTVEIITEDGGHRLHCNCPYFSAGYHCKHVYAVILASKREQPQFRNTRKSYLPKKRAKTTHWETPLRKIFEYTSNEKVSPLISQLDSKRREPWYRFRVVPPYGDREVRIALFDCPANSKKRKFRQRRLRRDTPYEYSDPLDQKIVSLIWQANEGMEHYHYDPSYQEGVLIPPGLYSTLFPLLARTGRFVSPEVEYMEGPLTHLDWKPSPRWKLAIEVIPDDENREWILSGVLKSGTKTIPIVEPNFIMEDGLFLHENRLSLHDIEDDFEWVDLLRKDTKLTIPFEEESKFQSLLNQFPHHPKLNFPSRLKWKSLSICPKPEVIFKTPENDHHHINAPLYAFIQFDYRGHTVSCRSAHKAITNTEKQQTIKRSWNVERKYLQAFIETGGRLLGANRWERADATVSKGKFIKVVRSLIHQGWKVKAHGEWIRLPGTPSVSVESGIDWFNVDVRVPFGDRQVPLPEILKAIKKDKTGIIRLSDGTRGLLPEEWLSQYAHLSQMGQVKEGAFQFQKSQAFLLDALLSSTPKVSTDATYRAIRKKMNQFKGIRPVKAPAGFQGRLRKYQEEGLGWLLFLQEFGFGGCLADDMGLGKTIEVLALLENRRQTRTTDRPSLVVVPRSLVYNWMEEAARFTPQLKVLDYSGLERKEVANQFHEHDVVLTTYGLLRRDILTLKEIQFDYVVLDEAHAIKNTQSQVAKAVRLLNAEHRLALTGTPVENHLGELWSLFEFLNPGMLGNSSQFKEAFNQGEQKESDLKTLSQALRPFILRRTKEKVLKQLPKKTEQTLYCTLSGEEQKKYDELKQYYQISLGKRLKEGGIEKNKIHVLEALLRLRQAACHPGLIDPSKSNEESSKLTTLFESIEGLLEDNHKALVFSQFTSLLSILRKRIDRKGIPYEYLDGSTRDRKKKVERFQTDPNCRLFLISLKAGGLGLNLTAADYVFILDPWWNPASESQAIDRAHRLGQTKKVFAYRLIAKNTVEEKILELQNKKKQLAESIISANNSLIRGLKAADLELLLS